MSEVLKNIELIEQYFEGKLSDIERASFESKLLIDPEFKEEYELYSNIVSGIKEAGVEKLRDKLKQADKELDREPKIISIEQPKKHVSIYWIAASVVLIFGLSIFWLINSKQNLNTLADKYYIKDKGLPVEMSIGKNKLDELMNKYKASNYLGAKMNLEKLMLTDVNNDTLNFYLAIVQYELGEFTSSEKSFETIQPQSTYYEKSEFYLALVYLKLEKKQRALEKINGIAVNPNHVFYQQAQQLSKELSPN